MTLREKRVLFTRMVAGLIAEAELLGLELALDEVKRSDEQAEIHALGRSGREAVARLVERLFPELAKRLRNNGYAKGIRASVHCSGLAVDVLAYRDGVYLASSEAYRQLGEWWEKQNWLARWGGHFGDGDHFSLEHEGVK